MKICILLPSLVGGGAEKLHIWLAKEWIHHDHEITFLVLDDQKVAGTLKTIIPKKCCIHVLGQKKIRRSLFPIINYLRKSKFDIFLVPMWPMTVVAVIAKFFSRSKLKIIISDHTNLTASRESELKVPLIILQLTIMIFYRFADAIIAVSNGVQNDISTLGALKKNLISVIYNPPALNQLDSYTDLSQTNLGWNSKYKHKILGVGSLIKQKNFSNLIQAFFLMPKSIREDSQLIVLGEGIERKALEKLIKDLSLESQISLPGFVIDPKPWFLSADLFVLSSSWEGFGIVLVEAMQSKLPIVSTNCDSGPEEILNNGEFGSLVECDNPKELSLAICKSLNKDHDYEKLFLRSQDFSIEKSSQEYLNIFKKVLK
ncbi:glycosyltransferase [Gammaproteobacteria bacterium]|nr:glycosyltransferase [Gammaproteobacteria bacterium]